jgi:hypothetical protein
VLAYEELIKVQRELRHEIEIDAPVEAVWQVIADTTRYGEWNPFIRRLSGELHTGARLEVEIAPPGGRGMTLRPTVLAAASGHELRWRGRLLVPGVFTGDHRFDLESLPGGRTRFVQSERFSGILVGLVGKVLARTLVGFEQMNRALKVEAERRVATHA